MGMENHGVQACTKSDYYLVEDELAEEVSLVGEEERQGGPRFDRLLGLGRERGKAGEQEGGALGDAEIGHAAVEFLTSAALGCGYEVLEGLHHVDEPLCIKNPGLSINGVPQGASQPWRFIGQEPLIQHRRNKVNQLEPA